MQERAEDQLLTAPVIQPQTIRDRRNVGRDLVGVAPQEGILSLHSVGKHAHRGEVRAAKLSSQPRVLKHSPGVIAETPDNTRFGPFEPVSGLRQEPGVLH